MENSVADVTVADLTVADLTVQDLTVLARVVGERMTTGSKNVAAETAVMTVGREIPVDRVAKLAVLLKQLSTAMGLYANAIKYAHDAKGSDDTQDGNDPRE